MQAFDIVKNLPLLTFVIIHHVYVWLCGSSCMRVCVCGVRARGSACVRACIPWLCRRPSCVRLWKDYRVVRMDIRVIESYMRLT